MTFFSVWPRQGYASYWPETTGGEISEPRIPEESRRMEPFIKEYLGEPARKPGKQGSFHKSAYSYFARSDVLELLMSASRGRMLKEPTIVLGREAEDFHQIWITNFVDCLDVENSLISPNTGKTKGKVGVIKRPAFDIRRWDGSDLFVLPQDPTYVLYCSLEFIDHWKMSKKKGVEFRRHILDPNPIQL
jgi:hypothetical protein